MRNRPNRRKTILAVSIVFPAIIIVGILAILRLGELRIRDKHEARCQTAVRSQMEWIADCLKNYYAKEGRYPLGGLSELAKVLNGSDYLADKQVLMFQIDGRINYKTISEVPREDPWGTLYVYKGETKNFELRSLGADKILSKDDIVIKSRDGSVGS